MPNNIEAEQAVLGAFTIIKEKKYPEVDALNPGDFESEVQKNL